jgi:hypothetical protein
MISNKNEDPIQSFMKSRRNRMEPKRQISGSNKTNIT